MQGRTLKLHPAPCTLHKIKTWTQFGWKYLNTYSLRSRRKWARCCAALPDAPPAERAAIFEALLDVLARLHAVDPAAVGLADFGRPGSYFARQVERWSQQWALSRTHEVPAMDALLDWLPRHLPADDATTLVHGDYRLGNLILDPAEPRVVAVLDWELSTLGHPLADLAYHCIFDVIGAGPDGGAGGRPLGLPSEAEVVAGYARRTGRDPGAAWSFAWTPPAAGSYAVTAEAEDAAGKRTESAPLEVALP